MRRPRFFLPPNSCSSITPLDNIVLPPGEARHLRNVLNLKPDEEIELIASSKKVYLGKIQSTIPEVEVTIVKQLESTPSSPITLFVGLTKGSTADFIVEKATELGIAELVFFAGDFSQDAKKESTFEKRMKRFERKTVAAMKQSGNASPPVVSVFDSLEKALKARCSQKTPGQIRLLLATSPPQPPLITSLLSKTKDSSRTLENRTENDDLYLIIGPEGGLSEAEQELATKRFSFARASLGPLTLRAETAVIVVLGIARVNALSAD